MKAHSSRVRRPARGQIAAWTVLAVVGFSATPIVIVGDPLSRGVAAAALIAGAALACLLAWRESRAVERLRLAAELGQAMEQAEQLHAERRRQRAVVDSLAVRLSEMSERLDQARLHGCRLQQELSTLKGNYEALRVELELQAVLNPPAAVVEMAQRPGTPDPWVTARELWRISDEPAMRRPA
ncbi:hypothetical protein [Micropruina sp.]|uniref:hypothetical protein n=1 Tax=Micropruina sp. TaxID=2737536 RepID=UPI0039E30F43